MTALDAMARLSRLADALEAGRLPSPADSSALVDGLRLFLDGAADLDEALGLRPRPGERAAQTAAALALRDMILRQAAERFLAGLSGRDQARRLADALDGYRASAWNRERDLEHCPARWHGRIEEQFWHALRQRDGPLGDAAMRRILGGY